MSVNVRPFVKCPKGVLIDLAGVLHTGDTLIPGALEGLERLRDAGIPLRFLTNTTRSTRATVVHKLVRMGLRIEETEVMTAVHATRQYVKDHGLHPHWLIHPDIAGEIEVDDLAPDAVVLGDAGTYFSFDAMNTAFRLLMQGLPLIAMAKNRYFQESAGLTIDMGAYVTALEYASGTAATIIGKPAPAFFHAAASDMGLACNELVMIGDDLRDDVLGAQAAGIPGILVRTGKYRPQDEQVQEAQTDRPLFVADDFFRAVDVLLQ